MIKQLHFKIWAPLVLALAAIACGGPSTTSNGGDPGVPDKPADVTVVETPVDFGFADCGGPAPAQKTVKIENKGGGSVSWTAEIEIPTFTVVGATSGTFIGGGSANVVVRPTAIGATTAAGTELRGTLVIIIDKQKLFRVPLRTVAQGATLTVLPNDASFGEAPLNVQAPNIPLTIRNTGNKEAAVSLGTPSASDFEVLGGGVEVKVAPGATLANAAARFRPTKLTQQSTTAAIIVKGAVCGASATAVTMSGKGTGGVVGVGPGQLDFGKVNCGAKGSVKAFTISNLGNSAFDWTATLANGTYFDLSLSDGTILAQNQAQVSVTPKDIPGTSPITDNLYGDTITITTTAPNDTPKEVALRMTAQGAILAFTAMPNDYGLQQLFGTPSGKNLAITNTGNATARVNLTSTTTAYSPAAGLLSVTAGATFNANINFAPITFGQNDATLTMTTSDVVCQPLPGAFALSGQGKGVAASVSVGARGRTGKESSACAVLKGAAGNNGRVACWGDNTWGQLGIGSKSATPEPTPVVVPNLKDVVQVAGGGEHNCARTTDGKLYCWGRNTNNQGTTGGQLGVVGPADRTAPTLVPLTNVISVSAAHHHTCAVATAALGGTNGTVYCWGFNQRGQLGSGSFGTDSPTPKATSIVDAVSVSATAQGGCARRIGNTVKCWGVGNAKGQLGTGNTADNAAGTPAADVVGVAGGTLATSVLASGGGGGGNRNSGLSCAVRAASNDVACWGDNRRGKIRGVDSGASPAAEPIPVIITGVANATGLATGKQQACAIIGGAVSCWGRGQFGQLGNGATPDPSVPVTVLGLANVTQISAGAYSTCAVTVAGSISCWGRNDTGVLGNPVGGGATPTVVSGF